MKSLKILICIFLISAQLQAQKERPVFRSGYSRLGINTLGSSLNKNLSPKENVFNGNYGAGTGYVAEKGRIFYFKPKSYKGKVNYGLDWTIFSVTYNKLDKWKAYATNPNETNIEGPSFSVSLASKLGPVVSFNPVEKLVVDLRCQASFAGRLTPFIYSENEESTAIQTFAFYNNDQEEADETSNSENIKKAIAFGVGTNFGITVRRGAIGLSVDYSSVNANTNYDAYEGENNHSFGKRKIPTKSLQLKLSFSL